MIYNNKDKKLIPEKYQLDEQFVIYNLLKLSSKKSMQDHIFNIPGWEVEMSLIKSLVENITSLNSNRSKRRKETKITNNQNIAEDSNYYHVNDIVSKTKSFFTKNNIMVVGSLIFMIIIYKYQEEVQGFMAQNIKLDESNEIIKKFSQIGTYFSQVSPIKYIYDLALSGSDKIFNLINQINIIPLVAQKIKEINLSVLSFGAEMYNLFSWMFLIIYEILGPFYSMNFLVYMLYRSLTLKRILIILFLFFLICYQYAHNETFRGTATYHVKQFIEYINSKPELLSIQPVEYYRDPQGNTFFNY